MAEKNAFEIRLELLKLANEIVNNKRCTEEYEITWAAEKGGHATVTLPKVSTEDVLREAAKLKSFVNG
jgi:hypothetical protein